MLNAHDFDTDYINWLNGRGFEPATRGNKPIRKSSQVRYSWMELEEFNDERTRHNKPRMSAAEYDEHKARIVERRNKRARRKAAEDEQAALEAMYREDMLCMA